MWYYIVKLTITAVLVVLVSELAKRSSLLGALLASLPLVSLLAFIWLYYETKDVQRIAKLSTDIAWLVIPSLLMFVVLPWLLRRGVSFWPSLLVSSAATAAGYGALLGLLRRFVP